MCLALALACLLGGMSAAVRWTQDAIPADQADTVGAPSGEDGHHDDRVGPPFALVPALQWLAPVAALRPEAGASLARRTLPFDRAAASRGPPEPPAA